MPTYPDGNQINLDLRTKLQTLAWTPNTIVDLHSLGVHYWTPDYLPAWLDPLTYATIWRRGLTPPNALPIFIPPNTQQRITQFLDENYHKLYLAGLPWLGNEFNIQRAYEWDAKPLHVCFCRISDYHSLDGAFGGYIINNFIQDFSDEIFADFAYAPPPSDLGKFMQAGLPLLFGNITKRPLTDFDVVIVATSYPGERINLPLLLARSGIPLYRWERYDHALPYYATTPVLGLAGLGASFIENCLADNPVKGVAQNSLTDYVLIGPGEILDFKFLLEYLNTVIRDGGSKEDFAAKMSNEMHSGVYDPRRVFFEFSDKIAIMRDHRGVELSRTVFPAAGPISRVSLLDHAHKTKHVICGQESEEFSELEPINKAYLDNFLADGSIDPVQFGRQYSIPNLSDTTGKRPDDKPLVQIKI